MMVMEKVTAIFLRRKELNTLSAGSLWRVLRQCFSALNVHMNHLESHSNADSDPVSLGQA